MPRGSSSRLAGYAGHGLEMDGANYLVPVDARLQREVDVRFETVPVDDLPGVDGRDATAAGDPGLPEQPLGAVDAAAGAESERERWQLRPA